MIKISYDPITSSIYPTKKETNIVNVIVSPIVVFKKFDKVVLFRFFFFSWVFVKCMMCIFLICCLLSFC